MLDLTLVDPPPAGLPDCGSCAWLRAGTPALCFSCANGGSPSREVPRCGSCGQERPGGEPCPNAVCALPDRWFDRLHTVTDVPEPVWDAIRRYKYDEDRAWAALLGRLLVGYLQERREEMAAYDLITTGALYVGPRARRLWDHLRLVLDAAQEADPSWPWAPDLITKSGPTGQFLGRGTDTRRAIAEHSLRPALAVPDPGRVAGRRVLVLDDVYSEGFSLREMARVLVEAGASSVSGIVFARVKGG